MDVGLTREQIMKLVDVGYVYAHENSSRQAFVFVEDEE